MEFREAQQVTVPFGKYKGRTIDDAASTDQGLLYLDWLRGERSSEDSEFDAALSTFLDDASIARELDSLR